MKQQKNVLWERWRKDIRIEAFQVVGDVREFTHVFAEIPGTPYFDKLLVSRHHLEQIRRDGWGEIENRVIYLVLKKKYDF